MGKVLDDRTLDRYLETSGFSQAEKNGLRKKLVGYLDSKMKTAYMAGVSGKPLELLSEKLSEAEWEEPSSGQVGISLSIAQLERTGGYASLEKLVEPEAEGGVGRSKVQRLLVYLSASGGGRLSGAKSFLWKKVTGMLGGDRGSSASELRGTIKNDENFWYCSAIRKVGIYWAIGVQELYSCQSKWNFDTPFRTNPYSRTSLVTTLAIGTI